jgi:signal transduction histidine kinase
MRLSRAEVELREIIEPLAERLSQIREGVEVTVEGSASCLGDSALLSRAFENLLRNAFDAVEARPEGPRRVRVSIDSNPSTVEIADTGVGLSQTDVPRLLLPFQSDKTTGYGIGLPLARKIILLHGGTLQLTGSPGVGATVTVTFHSVEAAGDADEPTQPQAERIVS